MSRRNDYILSMQEDLRRQAWIPLPTNPDYLVSDEGEVYSLKTKRVLKKSVRSGRASIVICTAGHRKSRYVASLVLETYQGIRPSGFVIHYADGDRSNCRLSNLCYKCRSEVGRHSTQAAVRTYEGMRCRLHSIWSNMKSRCGNSNVEYYKYYGGRGIQVCDEWITSFANFFAWAVSNGYQDCLTLDRIDNAAGYSPDNCRFVDMDVQNRNRSSNRYIEAFGMIQCVSDWASDPRCCVSLPCLSRRLRSGWSAECAITTPSRRAA